MPHPIYIIGHKNPDADAICSSIAYADFKHRIGKKNCVPARCGNSNARIDAILKRFSTALPVFIGDLTPRVQDIMVTDVKKLNKEATCTEVLKLIDEHDIQSVPVVDEENRVSGFISIFQLGEFVIPKPKDPRQMRYVRTSIEAIIEALDASVIHSVKADQVQDLYVRIGAMDIRSFGLFSEKEAIAPEQSIIVVGDRYDIQKRAIEMEVRLLVITGALSVDSSIAKEARDKGVSLIVSPLDSATTSWIIRYSTRIEGLVETFSVTFNPKEKLNTVRRKIAYSHMLIFPVIDEEERLIGVFSKSDILKPVNTQIILVDHNEVSQAVNGAEEVDIVEIIDHHRLGNLSTQQPILFVNEPVGSTCTIVAGLFRREGIEPSPSIAGIMMGGIISDTLSLNSPTTTEKDIELLNWLSKIAGVNNDELSDLIFSSGSIILNNDPGKTITVDCKVYNESEVAFSVSQVEELGFNSFWKHSEKILAALGDYREKENLSFSALLVTDINSQSSLLAVVGDQELIAKISYSAIRKNQIFDLPGIVSRKKQLIPYLTSLLDNIHFIS